MNRVICLFYERILRRADVVICYIVVSTWGFHPLYSRLEKNKWFLPFFLYGVFSLFLEHMWLLYNLGRQLISLLILYTSKCFIIVIDLFLFPTEYSVLDYSLVDNLMHYKKQGVIHELTTYIFYGYSQNSVTIDWTCCFGSIKYLQTICYSSNRVNIIAYFYDIYSKE